jgi:hypothetical protein
MCLQVTYDDASLLPPGVSTEIASFKVDVPASAKALPQAPKVRINFRYVCVAADASSHTLYRYECTQHNIMHIAHRCTHAQACMHVSLDATALSLPVVVTLATQVVASHS